VLEAAEISHQLIEDAFTCVTERRMSQIVRQAYRLGQLLIETKRPGDGPANLGNLDCMSKAGAVMVIEARRENLRFAFEPAKRRTVNYPVAVAVEIQPIGMRLFGKQPAFAGFFTDRVRDKL
jgi:hypothetical protein